MTKRTQIAYNKWADEYDTHPNPHILLEYDDILASVAPIRGEKILDAACGTGRYTYEFFKKGVKVIGIDFSLKMLKAARRKYPYIEFRRADLTKKLPFRNKQFDKINCAQALKHIKNLKPTLKEFSRVLRKGGFFVFSVTHPEMDWEGFETKDNPDFSLVEQSDIFHHRFKDYFDAFDSSGFKLYQIVQLPVSKKIKHLLTKKSYQKVKGRYEIIIFKLIKP